MSASFRIFLRVFFQTAELVDYFHRRHPSVLSESPAGSASVSFEPKEIQVPERLKIFLYGTLSRILRQVCLDVGERDGASSSNDLEEFLLQITEIVLDAAGCHVPSTMWLPTQGPSAFDIADLQDVTPPTVYRRIGCSGEQGPEGLFDREGEGLASTINY